VASYDYLNRQFSKPPNDARRGLVTDEVSVTPRSVIRGYRHGVCPWVPSARGAFEWRHPALRGVLYLDAVTISDRDQQYVRSSRRRGDLRVAINDSFPEVIEACATVPRASQSPWITGALINAYRVLHRRGIAHSVGVWRGKTLVGGVYGVDIDGVFTAESMFHHETNVTKLALLTLLERLREIGRGFVDTQMVAKNGLAERWGAQNVPRHEFEAMRTAARKGFTPFRA